MFAIKIVNDVYLTPPALLESVKFGHQVAEMVPWNAIFLNGSAQSLPYRMVLYRKVFVTIRYKPYIYPKVPGIKVLHILVDSRVRAPVKIPRADHVYVHSLLTFAMRPTYPQHVLLLSARSTFS